VRVFGVVCRATGSAGVGAVRVGLWDENFGFPEKRPDKTQRGPYFEWFVCSVILSK